MKVQLIVREHATLSTGHPNANAAPILIFSIILPTHPHTYLYRATMVYFSFFDYFNLDQLPSSSCNNLKHLNFLFLSALYARDSLIFIHFKILKIILISVFLRAVILNRV